MKETITSHDVARLAGVSQSTVSRTFREGGLVSADTHRRVMSAADALGYRPHVLARSLITGRSHIVGVVVAIEDAEYYSTMMSELSCRLEPLGYHILTFMTGDAVDHPERFVQAILDYRVDGLVVGSVSLSSKLTQRCADAGIPVVLFNRTQDDPSFSTVTTDNYGGGAQVAQFLLAHGHERIAFLAGREGTSTSRDREAGFCARLAESGRNVFARAVGNYRARDACRAVQPLFKRPPHLRPDALFVASDHMAIAVMDMLRFDLGLRLPEDVSLVGYDDIAQAAAPSYALTTVRQPTRRMVERAVMVLLAAIEDRQLNPVQIVLKGTLVVRRSARCSTVPPS